MERVVADPDLDGLAGMVAGLIRGNIEADPSRARMLDRVRGTVTLRAPDAAAAVGLAFSGGVVRVQPEPFAKASVEIVASSDALMAMSAVPLRFGFPDVSTGAGRAVVRDILGRRVIVRGMFAHPGLVRAFQSLMSVS